MAKPAPEVIRLSPAQLEGLVAELRAHLPAAVFELVHTALLTLQWVLEAMELKTTTIARLKRVLFGSKSEKTAQLFPQAAPTPNGAAEAGSSTPAAPKPKRRGHGRRGAQSYTGARKVDVPHPHLQAGDPCPDCGGHLSDKTPVRVVCIQAQPSFHATLYQAQVLRCNRCQKVFTAPWPADALRAKYDPGVGDMLGLHRFGLGVPMYRTARWQQDVGVPLPASTQWELMAAAAEPRQPICEAMTQVAAQATLIHTDDTTMRVQSLRREIAQAGEQAQRTGIFTTSLIADLGEHRVALYFIESLREVYGYDAQAREQNLSDDQRLRFHQEHSQPVLDQLHQWMTDQIEQKRVEPNSGLGQAIQYMLKRWERLTRFLKIPGAPLDNNIAERAIKSAILHRKNSLSFKTLRGAKVGDFFMSVIQTCRLNGANPFQYFKTLREHAQEMRQNPFAWLPWNFRQTLDALDSS